VLRGEATNTSFIVLVSTGLELTIYRIQGNVVQWSLKKVEIRICTDDDDGQKGSNGTYTLPNEANSFS